MRLISSMVALEVAVYLHQAGEARLSAIARDLEVPISSCQRGLEVLVAEGLARAAARGRYAAVEGPRLEAVVGLASVELDNGRLAAICGAADDAVELIGDDRRRLVLVYGRNAPFAGRARALRLLGPLATRLERELTVLHHDDIRRARRHHLADRHALEAGSVLYGDLGATFPEPAPVRGGAPTGRLAEQLPALPARDVEALRSRYGLRSLIVFGSAVRTDFRPDSDVDVAVVPGDRPLSFFELVALERELEQHLGRDVDLCLLPNAIDEVAQAVAREGVVLGA
ncbi:MAG TPA: nucleotidyltransferase domain-containing protein [Candidatus Dormibacteraeota bacterium]